jgi:hypothetical protein
MCFPADDRSSDPTGRSGCFQSLKLEDVCQARSDTAYQMRTDAPCDSVDYAVSRRITTYKSCAQNYIAYQLVHVYEIVLVEHTLQPLYRKIALEYAA